MRATGAVLASAASLAAVAALPAPGLAANTITVGVGETSIVVNGTTISTSNLTLAQLAKFQGVPPSTVNAELDGVAVGTPAAAIVEKLVATLSPETSLASALEQLSSATGGAISPQTALREVIQDEGQTPGAGVNGASGTSGSSGTSGASGAPGANGSAPAPGPVPPASKTAFTLRASSASLKGRPGSRVRVSYKVSSAAKLSYSGRKLAKGSRKVPAGSGVLMVKLPRKHGNYRLTLAAVSAVGGQSAHTSVVLHDAAAKAAKKRHH